MAGNTQSPTPAWRYELEVQEHGRVELTVPFSPGSRVVVLVMEESGESWDDLTAAARTTLDFWDNPLDDEDWNHAPAG
jgi:hypothetical protein